MAHEEARADEPWFAVRCLFSHPNLAGDGEKFLYEERVTLWKASSWKEAFQLAEAEAREYAVNGTLFIGATDAFHLFDEVVGAGAEIWSVMRGSDADAETYKRTFLTTHGERSSGFQG